MKGSPSARCCGRHGALAAWLALAMLLALGPRLAAEQLPIRSYTTADGLANDQVNCIVQDRHGFLWFCTQEGLSRFDGHDFTTFGHESGLPSLSLFDFLETGDGEYWVATGRGLCRFDAAARCEEQALGDGGKAPRVHALLKDVQGRLWVGTTDGLFRSEAQPRSGAFRAVVLDPALEPPTVFGLAESGDGSLWVATGAGLWRILPDGRKVLHEVESGSANRLPARLRADARGRIWIGHFGTHAGVTVFAYVPAAALPPGPLEAERAAAAPPECPEDLGGLSPGHACIVTRTPFPRQGGTAFATASDGTLWAGTLNAGLLHVEESGLRRYTTAEGLSSDAVHSVLEDRSGDLWIGTENRGVMRWARRGLVSYGVADGISPNRIMSLFTGPGGEVYAMNSRGLLDRFDGRGFEAVRPNVTGSLVFRFGFGQHLALQSRTGDWWMGGEQGLERFTGIHKLQDLEHARPEAVLAPDPPAAGGPVFEDSRGDVWAGIEGRGVMRWQRDTGAVRSYAMPEGSARSFEVTAFAEDRDGTVWVGLGDDGVGTKARKRAVDEGALVRIRGDRPELVTLDQLPEEPDIQGLYSDRAGRLWFAAGRGGLGRIDDPTAARPSAVAYGRAEGLSSETVYCVAEDHWGRIYVGTDMGVDRLEVGTGRIRNFGVTDGLVATDVTSAVSDDSGRLWFGTSSGVSVLRPEEDSHATLPGVRIMSVRIGGIARPLPGLGTFAIGDLELSAGDAPIEIAFAGVAPAPGWNRQYRFRLDGADKEWSAPTERHEVNYTRLAPGAYRFRVQAWSPEGGSSPEPSTVAFRIVPPVWRRWWFLSAVGVAAAVLAYAGFQYRLRMLLEVERIRTGIATDLHDDIGSSLSQISILSEVARRGEENGPGAAPLASIAQLSREIVTSMSDIVWAINPHRDSLNDLTRRMRAFAGETFGAMDVRLRFSAPSDEEPIPIQADLRRQVFLVFKEAATNAARHSGCREVTVDLGLEGDWLTLRVGDDGRGIRPEKDAEGHGLRSMADRARVLGGELEVRSELGGGATVTLRAPLRRRGWR